MLVLGTNNSRPRRFFDAFRRAAQHGADRDVLGARELDRFCDAMIAIRAEIREIEAGRWPRDDHPLKHAPHTARAVCADEWTHPYSRTRAAYPVPALRAAKYWSPVGRVDNVYGDRHLVCTCPPLAAYAAAET
jgi:glycine dehydrogenase